MTNFYCNTFHKNVNNQFLLSRFWSEGEPDNGNSNAALGQEDCVHFEMTTTRWNDQRCDDSKNFICEK